LVSLRQKVFHCAKFLTADLILNIAYFRTIEAAHSLKPAKDCRLGRLRPTKKI